MLENAGIRSMNNTRSTRLDLLSEWSDRHFKWLLVAPAVLLLRKPRGAQAAPADAH